MEPILASCKAAMASWAALLLGLLVEEWLRTTLLTHTKGPGRDRILFWMSSPNTPTLSPTEDFCRWQDCKTNPFGSN